VAEALGEDPRSLGEGTSDAAVGAAWGLTDPRPTVKNRLCVVDALVRIRDCATHRQERQNSMAGSIDWLYTRKG